MLKILLVLNPLPIFALHTMIYLNNRHYIVACLSICCMLWVVLSLCFFLSHSSPSVDKIILKIFLFSQQLPYENPLNPKSGTPILSHELQRQKDVCFNIMVWDLTQTQLDNPSYLAGSCWPILKVRSLSAVSELKRPDQGLGMSDNNINIRNKVSCPCLIAANGIRSN